MTKQSSAPLALLVATCSQNPAMQKNSFGRRHPLAVLKRTRSPRRPDQTWRAAVRARRASSATAQSREAPTDPATANRIGTTKS